MKITNDTTTYQIAERMGDVDERTGKIMLGILSNECITDTEEVPEDQWLRYRERAIAIRNADTNES